MKVKLGEFLVFIDKIVWVCCVFINLLELIVLFDWGEFIINLILGIGFMYKFLYKGF